MLNKPWDAKYHVRSHPILLEYTVDLGAQAQDGNIGAGTERDEPSV